jgi:hypothetical protein
MENQDKVEMDKIGWKPTPKKVRRGKPMSTNHTKLETLALDNVKWGEMVKG